MGQTGIQRHELTTEEWGLIKPLMLPKVPSLSVNPFQDFLNDGQDDEPNSVF